MIKNHFIGRFTCSSSTIVGGGALARFEGVQEAAEVMHSAEYEAPSPPMGSKEKDDPFAEAGHSSTKNYFIFIGHRL